MWLLTLDKSQDSIKEQEEKISISKTQYDDAETALEQIQSESESLYDKNGQLASEIEAVRAKIAEAESKIAVANSQIYVAQNDILHNNDNIERLKNEIVQADKNTEDLLKDIEQKQARVKILDAEIIEKQKQYAKISEQLNEINLNSSRSGDTLQKLSANLAALTSQSADLKVVTMTSQSTINELNSRVVSIKETKLNKEQQLSELNEILLQYDADIKTAQDEINSLQNSVSGLEIKLSSKAKKKEELKIQSDSLILDVKEHIRKINFLENLERNLEGFSKSVKIIVNAAKSGKIRGICGPVSRVISVPGEYGVAIETALGAAMQNIVVNTDEDAKQAIRYLKSTDGGRATFLPLNTIKSRVLKENNIDDCYGFVGIASELCSCEDKYKNVLSSLLGKIVVAEDLNSATAIAKKYSYRFKIVTLDGQVINAGGSFTGGSLNRNTGLLSRASEIEDLKKQTENLKKKSERAQRASQQLSSEYSAIEAQLLGTRADISNGQQIL